LPSKSTATDSFWARSFFFTLLQRFSLIFFGLASFFLLTHFFLDKAEVGVFALFQTTITMVEYLKMGLLRNALIKLRFDKSFANKPREVYMASLFINIVFSAFVVLVLLTCSDKIAHLLKSDELGSLLRLSCLLVVAQVPFSHCEIIQQSVMNYRISFYAYFIRQGLFFLFIAAALVSQTDFVSNHSLVMAQIGALTVSTIYYLYRSYALFRGPVHINMLFVRKLLSFGRYVFGTALLSYLYKFADHFLTAYLIPNALLGKVYVSYYNVVSRVSNVLDVPFMAVADVLFPKNAIALAEEGPAKVKYYFERMVGILTALIVPVSLIILVLPGVVIRIIAGPAYLPATPILQLTMTFAFLRPFYGQFGFTIDSIGKPQVNFWVNALCLTISLLSTFASIHYLGGLMGAAYANVFTLVMGSGIFYFVLRKHLDISLANIFRYAAATYTDLFSLIKSRLVKQS
jgi:lipopolysaccharide exporter